MSFQFPKPIPGSTNTSSFFGYEFDIYDEIHVKLMRCSGPDYDELIIPLSLYAFNRLSTPSDQQEQLEENDFSELFKKLNYSDQVKFLHEVLQKLKFQRLISSLIKQLAAEHQHRVIEQMAYLGYSSMCKGHTRNAHRCAWISGGDQPAEETSDYWKLWFSDFFVGFASIWFQGQFASGQEMLIEQLSEGVEGDLIEKCMQKESEEDFKLRRFTELCTKVIDFRIQEKFLDNVEEKLNTYKGWSLEPQDYEGAAKLFCDLSTLGFSKLSAERQYQMIEEMSNQVHLKVLKTKKVERYLAAEDLQTSTTDPDEEAIRIGRFRELFNQVSVLNRINLFRELRISLKHKQYSEAVQIFCGLGTKDQAEVTKILAGTMYSGTIMFHKFSQRKEKFVNSWVESEEDIRIMRRFKKVCVDYLSIRDDTLRTEAADKYCRVRQEASQDNEEESPYAEFLIDASILWFKARCANLSSNPIHLILSGEVEEIEKLPEESEDDYRLRRFTESFMRLPLGSQEQMVYHIQYEMIVDLGYCQMVTTPLSPECSRIPSEGRDVFDSEWIKSFKRLQCSFQEGIVNYIQEGLFGHLSHDVPFLDLEQLSCSKSPAEGRCSFDSEWIKIKLPNLQGQGAATSTPRVVSAGGSANTTQVGGTVNPR